MKRLFVYFAGIGDAVMFVPLLRRFAVDGRLDVLVRDFAGELFDEQSFVGHAWTLRHPNRWRSGSLSALFARERRALGRSLAAAGYDEVIVFDAERRHLLDWIEGWRGGAAVRRAALSVGHTDRTTVACESLGLDPATMDAKPTLEVRGERIAAMARTLQPLGRVVGLQVGSGPVSKWPRRYDVKGLSPDQWAGFAKRLLEEGEADSLVFQGTAMERPLVTAVLERLAPVLRAKTHDWTGRFGLNDLMAVMKCYRALVSVDTGPAHMAAAIGCPLLVFFGPSDPREYLMRGNAPVTMLLGSAPCQFCAGTESFKRCRDNRCLRSLSIGDLWGAWLRLTAEMGSNKRRPE